jgi:hypothetical protein
VNIIENIANSAAGVARGLTDWHRSTYMCSAPSQTFLYVLVVSWIAISLGGVYLWHRVIKTKPQSLRP